jgi:hypothetical protein
MFILLQILKTPIFLEKLLELGRNAQKWLFYYFKPIFYKQLDFSTELLAKQVNKCLNNA